MSEESSAGDREAAATPPGSDRGEAGAQEDARVTPAYGFRFATIAVAAGFGAFALTLLVFGTKFDATAATGALGSLFTLIGTVTGAYFGVKNSSDTAIRAAKETEAANDRTEKANRSAQAAWGGLDPDTARELRDTGLL